MSNMEGLRYTPHEQIKGPYQNNIRDGIFQKINSTGIIGHTNFVEENIIKDLKITDPYLKNVVYVETGIRHKILSDSEKERTKGRKFNTVGEKNQAFFRIQVRDADAVRKSCEFLETIKYQPVEIKKYWENFKRYHNYKKYKNSKYGILAEYAFKRLTQENMNMEFRFNTAEKDVKEGIDAFIGTKKIPCQIKSCNLGLNPNKDRDETRTNKEIQQRIEYLKNNMIKVNHNSLASQIIEAQRKKEPWENSPYAKKITNDMRRFRDKVFIATDSPIALEILIPAGEIINPRTGKIENQLNDDGTIGEWSRKLFEEQFAGKVANL